MSEVAIVDYGLNNLKSVRRAFEMVGRDVAVVRHGTEMNNHGALVLPGIGAFGDAMEELRERGLVSPIERHVEAGRPLLGICLGMQLLFSGSNEIEYNEGLDLLAGDVVELAPPAEVDVEGYKVPHVGWSEIHPRAGDGATWRRSLLEDVEPGVDVYFVHSYYPEPSNPDDVLAVGECGMQTFTAAVQRENVVGTQFHPEKSGPVGIDMIRAFCQRHDL